MHEIFLNIENTNEILNNWHPYMQSVAYKNSLTNNYMQYKYSYKLETNN
jgi:hypothetical protein